jgi:methyl-accepting chemotaxis protein
VQEQQQAVNTILDDTKYNIRKTTDIAIKEVPRYTKAFNDYQEEVIQTTRDIASSYLESQKEIIKSIQSIVDQVYYLPYPYQRKMHYLYGMMIASFVDNTMAAMKLANNTLCANMDVLRTSMQQIRENTTQLSKITTDAAKILEPASSASKT